MLATKTLIDRRYEIVQPIGSGGMGAVYEAIDTRLGRLVALKQLTVSGEKLEQAFAREARLLATLKHLNLPDVYDHFTDPQGQFLVMEYIPGDDLQEALKKQGAPFPVDEVLRWADQLLDVLDYLHTRPSPVIHRDIKPANIKVSNGLVKLLDFGLTKGSAEYVSHLSLRSVTGYTLHFAPPEQLRGKTTYPCSDLFALGATLYCLLTGSDPPNATERAFATFEGDPDPLQPASTHNASVPQAVSVVLLQAMALRYETRPATAAQMRQALRDAYPALWQAGGNGAGTQQAIGNTASNQGGQGIFQGNVTFNYNYGTPPADPAAEEAARQRAADEAKQREAEAARQRAAEEAQRREAEAARQRAAEEAQRREAARQRALLADPYYPTTTAQWQAELAQRSTTFGQPNGYFCYIPAGTYTVGGWGKDMPGQGDHPAVQHALPRYWIARYPITNAQFRPFIEGNGYTNKNYWTTAGWEWRTKLKRTAPRFWDDTRYNQPNQPVVGVAWYEAMAYAAWLTQQLAGPLPAEYAIRLPTEAEWEVAAAYDGQGKRRRYPWGDTPEPDADHAIFRDAQDNILGAAAPVGERVAGAAACGAADMAGNVWEWCVSSFKGYPQAAATFTKDFTPDDYNVPLRGGSRRNDSTYMPCGARGRALPAYWYVFDDYGLRVVCAPRLR